MPSILIILYLGNAYAKLKYLGFSVLTLNDSLKKSFLWRYYAYESRSAHSLFEQSQPCRLVNLAIFVK